MKDCKLAIPSNGDGGLEGERSGHFGHCDAFMIIDVKDGGIDNVKVVPNQEHAEGGCLVPVNILADLNVNALIVGGIGMRPLEGFKQAGIDVYHESESGQIKTVVEKFVNDDLSIITPGQTCGGGNKH